MTLTWNPSTSANIAGYDVHYGGVSGLYTNVISVGDATNATITGLVPGATYYFAATAYDSSGVESPFSNEAYYTVPTNDNQVVTLQPPTLNPLNNVNLHENAAPQTISFSGVTPGNGNEGQTLTVSAVSSNPALVPNPAVNYSSPNPTGTLSFQSVTNRCGTAFITVTVNNGEPQNNTVTNSFIVTVTNIPPLTVPETVAVGENRGVNLLAPLSNDAAQTPGGMLTLLAISPTNGTASIWNGTNVLFTPATNFTGKATIGYAVTDNIGGTGSSLLTVIVTNSPPVANPDWAAANENTPLTLTPLTNDLVQTPGGALSIAGVAPTNGTASVSSGKTILFVPATNFTGTATIGYTVTDGIGGTSSSLITVQVNPVNQPPTLDPIANMTINKNAGVQTVALTGITAGLGNPVQTLTVSASSGNTSLIRTPNVLYTSPNSTGTLSFRSAFSGTGAALITVVVNNGAPSNNIAVRTFLVSVVDRNNPPQILTQPTNTIAYAGQTATFAVSAGGGGGGAPLYQWQFNSVNIPLATNAVLTLRNVTSSSAGSYSVVVANSGGMTVSQPATLTVYQSAAAALSSSVHSVGGFSFNVSGVSGNRYVVEASTDMVNWIPLQTNTAPFTFLDSNAGKFSRRFYRAVYLP